MKKTVLLFSCLWGTSDLLAQWNSPVVVDASGNVCQHTCLAVVNGNPAISYYDETDEELDFVEADDAEGSSWSSPETVDDGGGNPIGQFTSLAVVDGYPAISYYDNDNGELMYVRADDASGSNWGSSETVDDGGGDDVGQFTSLAVVDGYPAISYYDVYNGELKYVQADDASGSSWNSPETVDDGNGDDVGQFSSLVVADGYPAISYYDSDNGELKFVRADDASGSSWGSPETVDDGNGNDVGQFASLLVVNGSPAISYYDATDGDLKYVRASDAAGSSWNSPVTVDATGDVGFYTCLKVVAGNPAICYRDDDNGYLKYVRADDASGTSWGSPVTVDANSDVGECPFLAVVNGNPAISYFDNNSANLQFVSSSTSTGMLPVELTFFKGKAAPQGVRLTWQTATELNNEGFEIQKAIGDLALEEGRWHVLDFQGGHGNTNEVQSYSYTDEYPGVGINYYRLKQIDFDGKFEYSEIVCVQFEDCCLHFTVFPNPVREGELTLQLLVPDASDTGRESTISLYSFTGELVLKRHSFSQRQTLKVDQLPAGMYFVEIQVERKIFREKVVLEGGH